MLTRKTSCSFGKPPVERINMWFPSKTSCFAPKNNVYGKNMMFIWSNIMFGIKMRKTGVENRLPAAVGRFLLQFNNDAQNTVLFGQKWEALRDSLAVGNETN